VTQLRDLLVRRIRAEGPMTIAEYMSVCLTHPKHGYYVTRDPLGTQGDFTTAPEISQIFGEMIGLAIAQYWIDLGQPPRFVLAELGPGRGTMMADILRATRAVPGFHAAADLHLVEASPVLRGQQSQTLASYDPRWVAQLSDLPDAPLFLVANEFFDALPIRQFIRQKSGWSERVIGLDGDDLVFGLTTETRYDFLETWRADTKTGEMVEYSLPQTGIAEEIASRIAQSGGVAFVFDYGSWGSGSDTFQAVSRHQKVHPLAKPGRADLTAHVDFRALASSFNSASLQTSFQSQGQCLLRWGIETRAQILATKLQGQALETHLAALRRLTADAEMGTLFKVLAAYQEGAPTPPGFDP
jgi:SAM-dependent MidA family methyltransferase